DHPACSSRVRRSATAGADRPTRRPSSARDRRASAWSAAISWRLVPSSGVIAGGTTCLPSIDTVPAAEARGPSSVMAAVPEARAPRAASDRIPPHAWFVVSAVFHYLGPAFAVLLFARVA